MRRLSRWLFPIFAGLSFFACVATIFIWFMTTLSWGSTRVYQYDIYSNFSGVSRWSNFNVEFGGGGAVLAIGSWNTPFSVQSSQQFEIRPSDFRWVEGHTKFWRPTFNSSPRNRNWSAEIFLPMGFLAAIAAIPPAFWLARRTTRRRQIASGICLKCGYDLRATPNLCPECGSIPEKSAVSHESR